jgi:uncharacterized protein (DUF885 family)
MTKHIDKGRGQTHYDGDDCSPKPQANGLDEIDKILGGLSYGYEFQMSDYAGSQSKEDEYERQGLAEIATAKQQIQALITEARIDELEKLDRTVEYIHQDTITDRLTQLKEKL